MSKQLIEELENIAERASEKVLHEKLPQIVAQEVSRLTNGLSEEAEEMRAICSQEYLTKLQAATFLQVSEGHIDNLMADDSTFPVGRVGKNIRIRRTELIEWVRSKGRRKPRAA